MFVTTYKELYFHLFNALTDAINELEQGNTVSAIYQMKQAQIQTEERHLDLDIVPDREC